MIQNIFFKASQGDIGHAVGLLTTQPAEVQDPGKSETSGDTWEAHKGTRGQIMSLYNQKGDNASCTEHSDYKQGLDTSKYVAQDT